MSFDATGTAGITQTASDSAMVGGVNTVTGLVNGQGGSFLFTATSNGTVTFTPKYRVDGNKATFLSHSIIVQVFG
jgi:hypothetical protein